jgi:hypothetical protein
LPDQLKDATFQKCLKDDKPTKHWLSQLLKNVEGPATGGTPLSSGPDLMVRSGTNTNTSGIM